MKKIVLALIGIFLLGFIGCSNSLNKYWDYAKPSFIVSRNIGEQRWYGSEGSSIEYELLILQSTSIGVLERSLRVSYEDWRTAEVGNQITLDNFPFCLGVTDAIRVKE